jgi:hypothetical protein
MTKQEVVEYDALMSRRSERFGAMAADISGTPANQYTCHGIYAWRLTLQICE